MPDRDSQIPGLPDDLIHDYVGEDSPHFHEFLEVSEAFAKGYTRFVDLGFPATTIGLAMLGATVNMFSMFGLRDELPALLRRLADWIDTGDRPLH